MTGKFTLKPYNVILGLAAGEDPGSITADGAGRSSTLVALSCIVSGYGSRVRLRGPG